MLTQISDTYLIHNEDYDGILEKDIPHDIHDAFKSIKIE